MQWIIESYLCPWQLKVIYFPGKLVLVDSDSCYVFSSTGIVTFKTDLRPGRRSSAFSMLWETLDDTASKKLILFFLFLFFSLSLFPHLVIRKSDFFPSTIVFNNTLLRTINGISFLSTGDFFVPPKERAHCTSRTRRSKKRCQRLRGPWGVHPARVTPGHSHNPIYPSSLRHQNVKKNILENTASTVGMEYFESCARCSVKYRS